MIPLLVIGLLWLSLTGVLCLLIGRAIRTADRHDEEQAERLWATRHPGPPPGQRRGGRVQATIWAPFPDELLRRPGIPRAGGRSPILLDVPEWNDPPPERPRRQD
jgi:hypothetical protein